MVGGSKLEALMDIEQITDARIVPFLLEVLADQREPAEVRIHVLKRVRNGGLRAESRAPVAEAILRVLSDRSSADLRLQAVLALAEFTDIDGVLATLGGLALNRNESIDVRYSAFTSLQRAGATPDSVAVLRQLSEDDTLGRSARGVLVSWQLK
ncbi:MAG TPA: HEAT repeat domain-containing protein [Chloroflexota bacterium]|nr:HEAT repeat domain-containing protein [Chloroflexota bacterium]